MDKAAANQFDRFDRLYRENKFDALLKEKGAVYWLKLRSISRKALLVDFCAVVGIDCRGAKAVNLFKHIYNRHPSENLLDEFITGKYKENRAERKKDEPKLISELYKLQAFDWGGLYQSNLERTIVNNYNKINTYLDKLILKDMKKLEVTFDWKDGKRYSALSDVVFVTK